MSDWKILIVKDSNAIKGMWKMALVVEALTERDGSPVIIKRSVHKIVVIHL